MNKTKVLASLLVVLAVLFMQVGNVAAAPQTQDTTPITGTIQSITTETDANGTTTVVVTLQDAQGATQTVRLSVDTAVALGLVTLDPTTQQPVVDQTKVGQSVNIDPTTVVPEGPAEEVHPIAAILADFFGEDPSVINGYHEDGFGFGVIAQALWMSQSIAGNASAAGDILQAKRSGDYSAFTLPDGSTPTNWGQFKKALRQGKDKHNLGVIVSGHGNNENSQDQQDNGNGKDKDKGKGKDKDKNKNKP
ncbi:MAG TPA: hypothetical protein VLE49_06430 [Anaerolineales bacterium]|nr:hypothetical protein [Anaerolineales bacterium]